MCSSIGEGHEPDFTNIDDASKIDIRCVYSGCCREAEQNIKTLKLMNTIPKLHVKRCLASPECFAPPFFRVVNSNSHRADSMELGIWSISAISVLINGFLNGHRNIWAAQTYDQRYETQLGFYYLPCNDFADKEKEQVLKQFHIWLNEDPICSFKLYYETSEDFYDNDVTDSLMAWSHDDGQPAKFTIEADLKEDDTKSIKITNGEQAQSIVETHWKKFQCILCR
jgi:hypothetical protein